jgi:branched-chain amino acid transport system permease protein
MVFLVTRRITRSPFGRALKVVREDEYVAQALGKNTLSFKVRAVAVGSILAGLAGSLWAHYISYISPADFTLTETILVLLCVVLGGRGTNRGPILGAFVIIFFQEAIRFLPIPPDFGRFVAPLQGMVYGAALIILMLKRPEGLLPEYKQ